MIRNRKSTLLLVAVICAVGIFFRFDGLTQRGIFNIEIYTPNIPLPAGLSDPSPRLSIATTISGTAYEPHPPTWYVLMFPYTRLLGTSLLVLRLPSVIFGVAAVLLMFLLGILVEDEITGLLGMGLLAMSPLHVLWSQLSRPNSMLCFLSLLSTCSLLLIKRGGEWQKSLLGIYLLSTFAALISDYYFWPVFATQLVWVFLCSLKNRQWVSGLLQVQMAVLILATPALSLAVMQNRGSYLSGEVLENIGDYLNFAYLFQVHLYVSPSLTYERWTVLTALGYVVPLLAGAFLAAGALRRSHAVPSETQRDVSVLPVAELAIAALCALVVIAAETTLAWFILPQKARLVAATGIFPVLFLLVAVLLRRERPMAHRIREALEQRRLLPQSGYSLMIFLLVVPDAIIGGLSLMIPFFMSRGMLYFAPYLLLVLASGINAICRLPQKRFSLALGAILLLPVTAIHYRLIEEQKSKPANSQDYKGLSEQLLSNLRDSDVLFISRHWELTPIFYYVRADRHQFIGNNYAEAIRRMRPIRIWVVLSGELPPPRKIWESLTDYDLGVTLRAGRLEADEFTRKLNAASNPPAWRAEIPGVAQEGTNSRIHRRRAP